MHSVCIPDAQLMYEYCTLLSHYSLSIGVDSRVVYADRLFPG